MCQNWFSVAGLVLDIIGFMVIAREWYWAIHLQGGEKVREIGNLGKSYHNVNEEKDLMWKGWLQQFRFRKWLFRAGFIMVLLGFLGQALGSWPYSVPFLGFKSC
jgi:hypothetical protein